MQAIIGWSLNSGLRDSLRRRIQRKEVARSPAGTILRFSSGL